MSEYYLMAQLPSLDGVGENTPLPITEERFCELCNRFLGKKAAKILNDLTVAPRKDHPSSGNGLVDRWYEEEKNLRWALAQVRGEKLKKTTEKREGIPLRSWEIARTAGEMTDPMEAEQYLNQTRLVFLETLRPADGFSLSAVYYYGLKLKLLTRIRTFDPEKGEKEYRGIYRAILAGEGEREQ